MFNRLINLQRDPGTGDDYQPSLMELERGIRDDGTPLIKPLPKPGDDAKPKPGEPGYVEPKLGDPDYVLKFGDEGYVLKLGDEGYEPKFGEEGYVLKEGDEGYVAPDPNADDTTKDFWAEVEKITGKKFEITYPDGVEADTPAGAAHRELEVIKQAQIEFEEHLAKTDPRSYAYMLHRAAGLPDEDFFGDNKGYSLPDLAVLETSIEAQTAVYKADLLSRGLDEDAVNALIAKAVTDNKLKEKAIASHTLIDKAQKQQLAELQTQQDNENKRFEAAVTAITTKITASIETEMGYVVPVAKKAEFTAFVANHLQYDNGKFFLVQEVADDKFKTQLESLFFQFVGGDLSTIVKKEAKTQAAQGLKLRINKAATKPTPVQGGDGTKKVGIPLGDL
jgi:hypothetical protein